MAQLVECLTSAQVMISHSLSLSPTSGSALTAQSLEPASDSVSPSLSAPPLLRLSVSKINKNIKNNFKKKLMFIYFLETETECELGRGRERERETQNPKQGPGSELSAQSPMWSSKP